MTTNITNLNETGLEKIKKHNDLIILAEIGALIHDLGKLSEEFINEKSEDKPQMKNFQNWEHHSKIIDYDCSNNLNDAKIAKRVLSRCVVSSNTTILDLVEAHHEKNWGKYSIGDYNNLNIDPVLKLLCASDKFDSKEDKGNVSDSGKQEYNDTRISNFCGFEGSYIGPQKLRDYREEVYRIINQYLDACSIDSMYEQRFVLFKELEKRLSKSLGETRRAANDVIIWQHSYTVASILKALIGEYLLSNDFKNDVDNLKRVKKGTDWKWNTKNIKEIIKDNSPFKLMSIGGDFFDFISQAHKIPDVSGRVETLDEIKEKVKRLIETEFLLGNCIYEDDYGLHFLIPASFSEDRIIKGKIYKIFNEGTDGILVPYFNLTEKGGSLVATLETRF